MDKPQRRVKKGWTLLLGSTPLLIDVVLGIIALMVWPSGSAVPGFVRFFIGFLAGVILWGITFPVLGVLVFRKHK